MTFGLTPEAQARIAAILARVERTLIDIQDAGAPELIIGKGILIVRGLTDGDRLVDTVVGGLGDIVAVIAASDLPAKEKREAVAVHQRELLKLFDGDPALVIERVHRQAWWRTFLDTLASRAEPPSLAQRLEALRTEARLSLAKLADETGAEGLTTRSIGRHLRGEAHPSLSNIRVYEQTFTRLLGRPITLTPPPPSARSPRKTTRRKTSSKRR